MTRIYKVLLPVAAIGGAIVVAGLLRATKPETPASPVRERSWPVETVAATVADVQPRLHLFGEIVAGRAVTLRALVAGVVAETGPNFVDGGVIHAGELVAAIDPFYHRQDLAEQRARAREAAARRKELVARVDAETAMLAENRKQLAISRRDLDRRNKLVGAAVSEKALDEARAQVSRAQSAVLQAEQQIAAFRAQIEQQRAVIDRLEAAAKRAARAVADTRLVAPFDGYLSDLAAEQGEQLRPGDPVARLIDAGRLEARVFLSDDQFARAFGDAGALTRKPVTVIWRTGEQSRVFDAVLDRVESEIDPTIGGIHVYARLFGLTPATPLRPGAFVEVLVPDRIYPRVTRLPEAAIHDGARVYAVVDGRLQPRAVTPVARDGDSVLVRGAVSPGEAIVVTRFSEIGPGVKVNVVP